MPPPTPTPDGMLVHYMYMFMQNPLAFLQVPFNKSPVPICTPELRDVQEYNEVTSAVLKP